MFFYRTMTIYIPFILFKSNGVSSFFTFLEILSFLKIQKKHSIQNKIMNYESKSVLFVNLGFYINKTIYILLC